MNNKLTPAYILLLSLGILGIIIYTLALQITPPSLYWDEMDVGYQAYSFLQTGQDYWGNTWPLQFHSFADYRTPIYIYATVPFVWLLGLTPLAVRLPAALFGVANIVLIYLVSFAITKNKSIGILAAASLLIIPWHVQYSRIAFEVTSMLALFLLGIWSFYQSIKRPFWLYLSVTSLVLSMAAYNTAKLFVPLMVILGIIIYWDRLKLYPKKFLLISLAIGILLVMPLIYTSFFQKGGQRFSEIAIFTDSSITTKVDMLNKTAGLGFIGENSTLFLPAQRIAFNKLSYIADTIITSYFSAYSTQFLFTQGDPNPRHSPGIDRVGQLYPVMAVGILLGFIALVISVAIDKKTKIFLIAWLLLAPLPSVITREGSMHATRLFFMIPPLVILFGLGTNYLWQLLTGKIRIIVFSVLTTVLLFQTYSFGVYYFTNYRVESAMPFEYGLAEVGRYAYDNKASYDQIIVDAGRSWGLMAYLFATGYSPAAFQKQSPFVHTSPIQGTDGVEVANIYFLAPGERNWRDLLSQNKIKPNTLVVLPQETVETQLTGQNFGGNLKLKQEITYPGGSPAYLIYTYK